MKENHIKFHSKELSMDFDVLVFGEEGHPIVLFPTSMGRYFENRDFGLIESAKWFIEQGYVKIYCPDGIDRLSWYNKNVHPQNRVHNHICYDRMLANELIPEILKDCNVEKVATAGCSFGGYHATNFAFKHPNMVDYVFNMSAAFDIKDQLDGYYNDDVYFNNPVDFIPDSWNEHYRDLMVFLGSGEIDACLDANIKMANMLGAKGIKNYLDVRKGAKHDWPVWKEMFPHYISFIGKEITI
jgi:esterase/lipase superfamily enzyme